MWVMLIRIVEVLIVVLFATKLSKVVPRDHDVHQAMS
jgi:hypothetical protein